MSVLQIPRRGLMGKTSILPPEYRAVDWIGVNGVANSYVDTGIVVKHSYSYGEPTPNRVVMELAKVAASSRDAIVISTVSNGRLVWPYATLGNGEGAYYRCSPAIAASDVCPRTTFVFETLRWGQAGTLSVLGYSNSVFVASTRLYSTQIYNSNDEKIFEGIPCYQIATDTNGLWDTVNSRFCSSVGTVIRGEA